MNDSDNTPSFQNDTISSDKEEMKQNNMSWNGNKNNSTRMSNPSTPGCDSEENEFAKQGGITNGAAWSA